MTFLAIQPLVLGSVLLWAACVKLFSRRGAIAAKDAALATLVGEKRAPLAWRTLGGVEAVLGLALLTPVVWQPTAMAAIAVTGGFCGYLVYARVVAPESSCGCMSAHAVRISWRSFARAGGLLLAAVASLWATMPWLDSLTQTPATGAAILAAEAVGFAALSAELDGAWLVPLRRLRVKVTKPLGGTTDEVPLDATTGQLQRCDLYRHVAALLRTDVRETWDEDDWRIVCYGATVSNRQATAVFAVPLLRVAPEDVKVAFVDDKTTETLLYLDSAPDEDSRPSWALPVLAS